MNPNILKDTLIKLLNSPVEKEPEYAEEPPPEITAGHVADIHNLATAADAAVFIDAIEQNIQLAEMCADAKHRATRLAYLKKANRSQRCQHMKLNGEGCGSPAVRGEKFCHFHAQAHAPSIDIPVI